LRTKHERLVERLKRGIEGMDILAAGRIFIKVVEHGSFSQVAKLCGVNASSISRQMSMLEQHLAVRLIHRSTRQLSISEAGKVFYGRMLTIVNDVEELELSVSQLTSQPRGLLRISATVGFGEQLLTAWLADFLQLYPDITVELTLTDQLEGLMDAQVDVAIRLTEPKDSTLIAQKLAVNEFFLCASPTWLAGKPAITKPEDVTNKNCLLYKQAQSLNQWQFIQGGHQMEVQVAGNFTTSSSQSLLKASVQGLGIALLTPWSARSFLQAGELVRLLPEYKIAPSGLMNTGIYVVYPEREFLSLKVKVLIEFLKQKFSDYKLMD